MPFLTALALGSFAYACAVLLTLAFHRQLTAALATVVVVFLTLICPVLILELLMLTMAAWGCQHLLVLAR
jgi:hypothetical protein